MRPRSSLFDYQQAAAAAAVERRRLAMLLAPGYGKTGSTLTALRDLDCFPSLVVAPARLVESNSWGAEAAAWEHLSDLRVQPLVGSPAQRKALLRGNADVEAVSFESFLWLSDNTNLARRYRSVVFDELSKMKAPGTRRFKRARSAKGGFDIPIRFGLTGSPVGNHLLDLWAEMMLIGGEAVLGGSFGEFQSRYFRPVRFTRTAYGLRATAWEPLPGAKAEIFQRVKRWSFALPPQPSVRVPPVRANIVRIPMPREHQRVAAELQKELVTELASGQELEALSGSLVAQKLRQLAGGAVWLDGDKWEQVHPAKLDALADLVDELQGTPLLTFAWFRPEFEMIKQRFPQARELRNAEDIAAWNRGEVELLLAHPQSAGHGLNLQQGSSHLCFFTAPWSHELRTQCEGRLARTGQVAPWVTAHWLCCGPTDAMVLERLEEKGATERELMEVVGR